jgi:DNA polymerase-1
VRGFIDRTLEQARAEMKVATLFGRLRLLPDMQSKELSRVASPSAPLLIRLAGTAADLDCWR